MVASASTEAAAALGAHLPYCGAPPDPATLLWRWNLDPILLTAIAAVLVAYMLLAGSGPPWRRACFYGGWSMGAAALISPLCPLSVSLFSARVGQHMILEMIVAPLIALGLPSLFQNPRQGKQGALASAAVFAAALWLWHAPAPYAATFTSDLVYWVMHLSAFGAALWLWAALLSAERGRLGDFLAAALATTVQMGFLGAIITFAPRPLYRAHWLTTSAWGLTPMQDQQLGGVIMWIPAGAILVVAIVAATGLAMRGPGTGSTNLARA